jgi:hypothetical protein
LTDATVMPSSSATSLACQRSTSRRISTARCAAAGAAARRRTPGAASRAARRARRVAVLGQRALSAIGMTQSLSTSGAPSVVSRVLAGPMSIGAARRCGPCSMSRQTFVAIL